MIQDILPEKLDNQYKDIQPEKDDRVIAFYERMTFINNEGENIEFLTYEMIEKICKDKCVVMPKCQYLISVGEDKFFLVDLTEILGNVIEDGECCKHNLSLADMAKYGLEGFKYHKMFSIRAMKPKRDVYAISTAWHLYLWYKSNRYCGGCGKELVHDKSERMLKCPVCNNMVFPKIAPAVIVGVTNGDKILMTKYADREYKRYALIAGFTEIGETAEETVAREVMEEVGLKVKNITYYKSQPWGFDSNLLLGFFAELDGDDEINIDRKELSVGEWIHWSDIPEDKEKLSLTAEMMWKFRTDNEK